MKKVLSTLIAVVCVFACTLSLAACGDNDTPPVHTHNWSTTYTPDEEIVDGILIGGDRHYQTCDGCDEKRYSNHDYGTSGVCVCGKVEPVAHTHNWSTTYIEDGDRHYQTCDGCDEKQYSDHDYGTSGVCVCGKEKPVTTVAVESVTLNENTLTLEVGDTATLTATVAPDNATDKTVTYSVEPTGIVTVDNSGLVTAVAAGTATITATANGKTAQCSVTVNAPVTNAQVLKYLNDNVLMEAVKSALPANWAIDNNTVINTTWYITKDGENVTCAILSFVYLYNVRDGYVTFCKAEFSSPLTPQNIRNNDTVTPTYSRIYRNYIDLQMQDERADLTNAICDKLFGANQTATRYIIDNGNNSLDPTLSNVSRFTVIEITDTEIKEKSIKIVYASTDDGLIANLNDTTKTATYGDDKSYTITGDKLADNNDKF